VSKQEKLDETAIAQALSELEGWKREDEKWIVRQYRFPSFRHAVAYVNEVAEIAEQMNHHPMIAIDFRRITLRLTTWHAGGLTELDLESATRYDACYRNGYAGEQADNP